VLYEDGELESAREHYETALRYSSEYPEAHQGLACVLAEMGNVQSAAWHRRRGFEHHSVRTLPYRGEGKPVLLLLLVSAFGGNIPTRHLLDDSLFEITIVVPEFYDLNLPLPPHQLVFNAIGDADRPGDGLVSAQSVVALTTAPVLNSPAAVMATGRANNAQRLSCLPGVTTPATVRLARELLSSPEGAAVLARHGLFFPLLLRTPGYHTGRHFALVERADDLTEVLAGLPGTELIAIQYLDSRGDDGKVRKYRVMMIDGCLYPLHLAVSSRWKIHYSTAEMADNAEHRAEDAAFLDDMPTALGPRAMRALEQIQRAMGLDYAGVDFGLSPAGDLLLFETNATMVVHAPPPDERWSYRRPAVDAIFAAVRRMLLRRANR
jgi:TPR repeat